MPYLFLVAIYFCIYICVCVSIHINIDVLLTVEGYIFVILCTRNDLMF